MFNKQKARFFSSHVTGKPSNGDYDVKNLLDQSKTQVKFTDDEIKYGEKQLNKKIKKNQKIICIAIRDGLYLKKNTQILNLIIMIIEMRI